MNPRKPPVPRKKSPAKGGIEWIGGIATMPAFVTGEGEPYRPEALLWIDAGGKLLGLTMARPGAWDGAAVGKSLRDAMEKPMQGAPRAPARVRTESAKLAEHLRATHPEVEVVLAPTPEFNAIFEQMSEMLRENQPPVPSYLSPRIEPDATAALFRASAALFRAKPWKAVPVEHHAFLVTVEALGMRDAVVAVIGQAGENFGLILFASMGDFEKYLRAGAAIEGGGKPKKMPPLFSLNFERGADLDPEMRKEVARRGWEVAAPDAYPWLLVTDGDLVSQPVDMKDVVKAEALALAFARLMDEKKTLRATWASGENAIFTVPVETSGGAFEVLVGTPL